MKLHKSFLWKTKPFNFPKGEIYSHNKKVSKEKEKIKYMIKIINLYKNKILPEIQTRKPLLFGKKKWEELLLQKKKKLSDYEYELLLLTNPDIKKEIDNI
jgi:hypothetical protein